MLSIALAALSLLVIPATATKNQTACADDIFYRPLSCDQAGLTGDVDDCTVPFVNANASGTAGFGVDQTLLGPKSGNFSWTFTVNARQPFLPARNAQTGGDIETGLWYSQPDGIDLHARGLPFGACAIVFIDGGDRTLWGLTQDSLQRGQNDDGTCSSMLSQQCITDLTRTAANVAQNQTARSGLPPDLDPFSAPGLALKNICNGIAKAVNITIASEVSSCRPFFNSTISVKASSMTAFQTKCNAQVNGTKYNLIGDFNYLVPYMDTYSAANRLWYNSLVTRVTPILTVFMPAPNSSQVERVPQSQALMNCIPPMRYNTDSSIARPTLDYSAPLSTLPAKFFSFSNDSIPSNTTASPSPSTTSTTSTPESSSLSGGAIGGIVVGAMVGLFLLIGVLVIFIRRGRRDHEQSLWPAFGIRHAEKMEHERFELDGTDSYELDARKSSIMPTPMSAFGFGQGEKTPAYQTSPPPLPAPPPLPPLPEHIARRLGPNDDYVVSP